MKNIIILSDGINSLVDELSKEFFHQNIALHIFNTESLCKLKCLQQIDFIITSYDYFDFLFNLNKNLASNKAKIVILPIIDKLNLLNNFLYPLCDLDYLTGAYTRKGFEINLEDNFSYCKKNNLNLQLMIIDIDNFKEINDFHGHLTGDDTLKNMAKLIRSSLRSNDFFARIGGDEFALIFNSPNIDYVIKIAERIINNLKKIKVSISVGIAEIDIKDVNISDLIRRADKALYIAKKNKVNKIIVEAVQGSFL